MSEQLASSRRRVLVLGTGGTIAGRAAASGDNIGYVAGQVAVAELLAGLEAPAGVSLEAEQVAQVDSKDMEFSIWLALARRCAQALADPAVAGVVITHGTDTLEETAFFLHSVLASDKPVVLTCAMRPASALSPDGPQNVRDAVVVAASHGSRGVSVVCAGVVHTAADVQKVHTYRLDAFSSGDGGPIGFVEEGQVRVTGKWPEAGRGLDAAQQWPHDLDPPRVEILFSHAGARGALIDALLAERAQGASGAIRGLVLAATGNGTLHHEIEQAAARAQAAGVAVVRATRCSQGRILAKPGDAIPDAGALSPVKARVALMLELLGAPSL
ncbi:asparaginase [Variovorax sp. OV329]|uniref:asparaginase n=1 Tax=Variovorax sp. OV329 TaxID=1882825 RepID=UPI0008EA36A0|nr:asparaginase [Variovorax sp. OV329]SFM44603.1 L-asparaginase [Variovorax sp. OV329]